VLLVGYGRVGTAIEARLAGFEVELTRVASRARVEGGVQMHGSAAPTPKCNTEGMPTTRHRYSITETDELARTLDAAARVWPEHRDDRGELLRLVLHWGAERVDKVAADRHEQRRRAIREMTGSMPDVWPPGAAQQLKEEWPA
jgi:hypothetical protein